MGIIGNSNQWVLSEYAGKDAKMTFDSFDFEMSLDELYDRCCQPLFTKLNIKKN